jgi:hypothetical protein
MGRSEYCANRELPEFAAPAVTLYSARPQNRPRPTAHLRQRGGEVGVSCGNDGLEVRWAG